VLNNEQRCLEGDNKDELHTNKAEECYADSEYDSKGTGGIMKCLGSNKCWRDGKQRLYPRGLYVVVLNGELTRKICPTVSKNDVTWRNWILKTEELA